MNAVYRVQTGPHSAHRWFFQQLLLVFDFYHKLGLRNREVRLHNLMLVSDSPRSALKICDFEYSKTEQAAPPPPPSRPRHDGCTPAYTFWLRRRKSEVSAQLTEARSSAMPHISV